jgi:tRNA (guanine-N7-)-methyltransferase
MSDSFPIKPEFKQKPVRSFVIRAGRMTDGQKNAFEQWWPTYGLSLFGGPLQPAAQFGRTAPLVLEIGFGMGASLIQMAEQEPDKDFVGIEVHPPGVGSLLHSAGKAGLGNLKVYMADAVDVLEDCVADGAISRFQLFFPDPWHKKKHNKRRIVQPDFIQRIRPKLEIGGIVHFATDWEPYAEHMMEVLSAADGFANTAGEFLFAPRPEYRPVTKFEKRGERLGHGVWDLLFQRVY